MSKSDQAEKSSVMFEDRASVTGSEILSEVPKSSRSVRTNLSTKTKRSSKSSRSFKTDSIGASSWSSTGSSSSRLSATAKKAVLLARLKSHEDLESLKEQQSRERFEFEEEQLKLKSLQEAEELKQKRLQEELQRLQEEEALKQKRLQEEQALKQKRLQEEEELKLQRRREEEELKLIRLREERERKHQRQLTEARIRAEINETQAVIDADEHQTLSADNQITVSNFLTERSQHVNIGDEVPGPSKISESVLYRPSINNVISTSAFRVNTKIASSALPKRNPRENVMLKSNVTKGTEPVQNGTPSYMPSQFIRHPAAPFQSFTNPADATHQPTVAQNQWVTNSQPVDYFSATRPATNTIPRT